MSTMKKFLKYFILFLITYFLVSILSFQAIKTSYKTTKYSIDFSEPKVEILEAKATVTNGYVRGRITNNIGENLANKLLKLDFLSPRGVLLGSKYVEIGNLLSSDSKEFESKFNFDNVNDIKMSLIDKADVPNLKDLDFSLDDLNKNKTKWPIILLGTFIFFGEDIVMMLPFL